MVTRFFNGVMTKLVISAYQPPMKMGKNWSRVKGLEEQKSNKEPKNKALSVGPLGYRARGD